MSTLKWTVSPALTLMSVAKPWIDRIAGAADVPLTRGRTGQTVLAHDRVRRRSAGVACRAGGVDRWQSERHDTQHGDEHAVVRTTWGNFIAVPPCPGYPPCQRSEVFIAFARNRAIRRPAASVTTVSGRAFVAGPSQLVRGRVHACTDDDRGPGAGRDPPRMTRALVHFGRGQGGPASASGRNRPRATSRPPPKPSRSTFEREPCEPAAARSRCPARRRVHRE